MRKFGFVWIMILLLIISGCAAPSPNSNKASTSNSSNKTKVITVAGNGGKIERFIREVITPKFKEKYGLEVEYIPALSSEILSKVELQKNSPSIDVAFYGPVDIQRAYKKDLAETLNANNIPNLSKIDDRYVIVDNIGAPFVGYVVAPAYNTETFKKNNIPPIQSWNDLIRKEYEGKTAFSDITNDWTYITLISLAKANGGSLENIEPGLEKAKDLAAYSKTFYKNSTQMIPAIQQGAADVTVMGSYIITDISDSGVPLKMVVPKEGIPLQSISATIVKNTPNKKAAEDFINLLLDETSQEKLSDSGFYPTLKGMKVASKYEDVIGIKEEDAIYSIDIAKLSELVEEWADRWSKEVRPELGKKVK